MPASARRKKAITKKTHKNTGRFFDSENLARRAQIRLFQGTGQTAPANPPIFTIVS